MAAKVEAKQFPIFDSGFTTVMGGTMVKVLGWYDNEYGYSCRTVELIEKLAAL